MSVSGAARPRGSRNRLSEQFLADLQADWKQHGADVIEGVRRDDPVAYLRPAHGRDLNPGRTDYGTLIKGRLPT
jgi:hypothetical protein